jgi:hypothetical protein
MNIDKNKCKQFFFTTINIINVEMKLVLNEILH